MATDDQILRALEEQRGLSLKTCVEVGIIAKDGKLGFQYVRSDETLGFTKWLFKDKQGARQFFSEPKGAKSFPFNLHNLPGDAYQTCIITEGELDAASFWEAGFHNVVSVPRGGVKKRGTGDIIPVEDRQFDYLWTTDGNLLPELARARRYILAVDDDEVGEVLLDELSLRLDQDKCWIVEWPAGCKDANDVLKQYGIEGVRRLYHGALELRPTKLVKPSQVPRKKVMQVHRSGWKSLDPHLGLCTPDLVIISGRPGSGKSQWALAWGMNMSRIYGCKGALLSFEDRPHRTIGEMEAFEEFHKLGFDKKTGEVAEGAWIDEHIVMTQPPRHSEQRNLAWFRDMIRDAAIKHGCKWIVCDPWNELEVIWPREQTETLFLNRALSELKALAEHYGINIIIVAHPDKGAGGVSIAEMSLYSISGGAAWKNKADVGIILDREKNDSDGSLSNWVTVKVDKLRNQHDVGTPGSVRLFYDKAKRVYQVDASEAAPVYSLERKTESGPALEPNF